MKVSFGQYLFGWWFVSRSEYLHLLICSCGVVVRLHEPKFPPLLHGNSRSCQDVRLIKPVVEYILIHNHQFGTTSVYWYIYSGGAVPLTWYQLLSTLLNCGLLGVLSVQVCEYIPSSFVEMFFWQDSTVLYYLAFPHDWVYMKCLVYGIYVLEVMQSILFIENGFRIFVTSFGDVEAVDRVGTAWLSVPILTAIGELCCVRHGRLTY